MANRGKPTLRTETIPPDPAAPPGSPESQTRFRFLPIKNERTAQVRAARYQQIYEHYVVSGSLTEALRKAGFNPSACAGLAGRLKERYPEMLDAVRARRLEIARSINLTHESVFMELARLAFSDMTRAVSWGPDGVVLVDSDMLDEDTRAAIQEVSVDAEGRTKLKLHDKKSALVDLGKFMGMAQPGDDAVARALAKLAGQDVEVQAVAKLEPRELARRAALLLRQGRLAGAGTQLPAVTNAPAK